MNKITIDPHWPKNAIPQHWIESLFEKMLFTYGSKFTDQWNGVDLDGLKKFWAEKLGELRPEQLKVGVSKLSTLDWPPSLSQFIKLCCHSIESVNAYYEALYGLEERDKGNIGYWSHPAIFWAASKISFDLRNQTFSQIKSRWEKELEYQLSLNSWNEIPIPSIQLPEPGKSKLSVENQKKLMNEYNATNIVNINRKDYKQWARNIIELSKDIKNNITSVQIDYAKRALDNK